MSILSQTDFSVPVNHLFRQGKDQVKSVGINADPFTVFAKRFELDNTVHFRKQSIVPATSYIRTWVDLGAKQDEVQRLTEVAGQLQVKPDALLPNILEQTQPDGFDCQTSLESGFRQLYCSIRSVVGFRKMQSISGLSIFRPGGPHEDEVNLSDKRRFGHYNPEFLTWLDDYIIPEGRDDAQFNRLTQLVYKTHVGPISRAFADRR